MHRLNPSLLLRHAARYNVGRLTCSVLPAIVGSVWLLAFARTFDFKCDDAFIAFRYAEHWVTHGRIEYNLGERVEGYTSFGWVMLLASLRRCGVGALDAAQWLGAASALLLLVGATRLASVLDQRRCLLRVALPVVIASNASIAAWTLGGLETPLFAALVVLSSVSYHRWLEHGDRRRALAVACCCVATSLTRPEALLLVTTFAIGTAAFYRRERRLPAYTSLSLVVYLACLCSYALWRHAYYGEWLPNTFFVKTSGSSTELRTRGLAYLGFAASEFGWPLVAAVGTLALLPLVKRQATTPSIAALRVSLQCFTGAMLVYIASIGGDFLDLYRFIVPLLPIAFALALWRFQLLVEHPLLERWRWFAPAVLVLFFAWYFPHEWHLAQRAQLLSESGRREHGIEPIGWTRTYALRWAATGRWLAQHARAGDTMAVGAAGAMPFYAQLPNIDTFGLCDSYVAHHGKVIGARPGHQRFAPLEYLLRRAPTFLLINDYASDWPTPLRNDPVWEQRGYQWVEAEVTRAQHLAPRTFFHYFLVRSERAAECQASRTPTEQRH